MMPLFGLAPLGFLEVAPPDLIVLAAEAGFASVNLRTRPAVAGGAAFPIEPGSELSRRCRRRIAATGVRVLAIEQVGLDRTTDVSCLRAMLEAGAELGASRVLCSGDEQDAALLAQRFAELCRLAEEFGMAVELEFMPFRALKTLEDAVRVVAASGAANGRVCLDVLHLFRSGGSVAAVCAVDPERLGSLQLCDAPRRPPLPHALAEEAREYRLLPGRGELPLAELLKVYPPTRPIDAELPITRAFPNLGAADRARLIAAAMRACLQGLEPGTLAAAGSL
jgi:sugar phosphate isomerase/epimerase